jgi:hypothetical protein
MLLAGLLVMPAAEVIPGQHESLRGLFLKTRPSAHQSPPAQPRSPEEIALGYTLFRRDASGRPVRVSPRLRFDDGDAIFVLVESNADGYLYLFNRQSEDPLRMIFPDLRIDRGNARLVAHVPLKIPSDAAQGVGEWYGFSSPPQPEELFLIFVRQPVSGWPQGKDLLQYPGGFQLSWEQFCRSVGREAKKSCEESSQYDGQPLSVSEQLSLGRGLTLSRHDPPPSVVEVNRHNAHALMIEIKLRRR